jgi:hypothetical protein
MNRMREISERDDTSAGPVSAGTRRRRFGVAVALGAATLMLALSSCAHSPPAPTSSASASSSQVSGSVAAAPAPPHKPRPHLTGPIIAQSGPNWTIKSKKGKIYTVVITDKTKFGTKKHPANRGQFTVGTLARVTGHRSGSTSPFPWCAPARLLLPANCRRPRLPAVLVSHRSSGYGAAGPAVSRTRTTAHPSTV